MRAIMLAVVSVILLLVSVPFMLTGSSGPADRPANGSEQLALGGPVLGGPAPACGPVSHIDMKWIVDKIRSSYVRCAAEWPAGGERMTNYIRAALEGFRPQSREANVKFINGILYGITDDPHFKIEVDAPPIKYDNREHMESTQGGLRYATVGDTLELRISLFYRLDMVRPYYDKFIDYLRRTEPARLTIDLRGNPGGDMEAAKYLLRVLLEPDTYLFTERERRGDAVDTIEHRSAPGPDGYVYRGPVHLLIDGTTFSASELMTVPLIWSSEGREPRATVEGTERTRGGPSGAIRVPVPDSDGYTLHVPIMEFDYKGMSWFGGIEPRAARDVHSA